MAITPSVSPEQLLPFISVLWLVGTTSRAAVFAIEKLVFETAPSVRTSYMHINLHNVEKHLSASVQQQCGSRAIAAVLYV